MRTGLAPDADNVISYSPVEQRITLPEGLTSAHLHFWRYRHYGDRPALFGQSPTLELPEQNRNWLISLWRPISFT